MSDELYLEPVPDYVVAVVNTAKSIHLEEPEGDILAFLTGAEEVDRAVNLLKEQITDECNKYCKFIRSTGARYSGARKNGYFRRETTHSTDVRGPAVFRAT